MYMVPGNIPQHCNHCPFAVCNYNLPFERSCISGVDGLENTHGTYGYTCNLDFHENQRYTRVLRANIGEDIERPAWCRLKEIGEGGGEAHLIDPAVAV
jgi:hypothetical protein